MAKVIFTLLLTNMICLFSFAQSLTRNDSIFLKSEIENKGVFLVFSGSDWCANCIRFEKQILQDSSFRDFLQTNFIYLNADFPQRKKQSALLKKQNEVLAEQYNPDGIFPTILLCFSDKQTIPIFYQHETAEQFIDKLDKTLIARKKIHGTQD